MEATSDMCLLRIWNVARMTQELSLQCYSILINFNLSSHMWLMATILDSTDLDPRIFQTKKNSNVKALKWEWACVFKQTTEAISLG